MQDLWPQDIVAYEEREKAPVVVLREQAINLTKRTQGLIIAEVIQVPDETFSAQRPFRYKFALMAPSIGQYRFVLFKISYDIDLYPVRFDLDLDISRELFPDSQEPVALSAESEEEFLDRLRKLFAARKTRRVIAALLAQMGPEQIPAPY